MPKTPVTSQLKHSMATWGVRIVWVFIVCISALTHFHILPELIHSADLYLLIVVSMLLFLSEILNEWHREIFLRLETQSQNLGIIQESMRTGSRLFTLEESTQDLFNRLKNVEPGRKVVIEHFGLDMTFAWEKIAGLVEALPNVTELEYRLLILSSESSELTHFDADVKDWMISGRKQRDILSQKLKELKNHCEKQHRSINYEMRTYTATPIVHGIRILEPFHAAYVAMCRWGGDEYNYYRWGGSAYHLVVDTSLSDSRRDILEIFNGNFHHFWRQGSQESKTSQQV